MSTAREEVLDRIRWSLQATSAPPPPVVRAYNTAGTLKPGTPALVDLFEDRLVDYQATVLRTATADIAAAVASELVSRQTSGLLAVPDGLDTSWYTGSLALVDDVRVAPAHLDDAGAVLTACAVAIATTGTIVLDASPDQGRRVISLVPDLHLCVVRVDQIVENVPDALRKLDPARPVTFISGGSATSDIELHRVEGVHGPRSLVVLIAG